MSSSFASLSINWKRRSAVVTELLIRVVVAVTLGLTLVLLLRRPARRAFGAGPAFTLWLLPIVLELAPLLPQELAPAAMAMCRC
jgi:beta-lactamase regulating signal transducer with metallopeptidase domain